MVGYTGRVPSGTGIQTVKYVIWLDIEDKLWLDYFVGYIRCILNGRWSRYSELLQILLVFYQSVR
jgi:hypothetical protein